MNKTEQTEPQFALSSREEDPLVEYKSISTLAIVALFFGLLSPLAMITPVLSIISVIGVITAFIAAAAIERRKNELRGRRLVLIALGLSTVTGAFSVVHSYARTTSLTTTGRGFAEHWIQLVRNGKLQEAHQLHRERHNRKHPLADYATIYNDSTTSKDFDRFFRTSPLSKIREIGNKGELVYLGHDPIDSEKEWEAVSLRYAIKYERAGRQRTIPFRIIFGRRDDDQSASAAWHVFSVRKIEEPPDS